MFRLDAIRRGLAGGDREQTPGEVDDECGGETSCANRRADAQGRDAPDRWRRLRHHRRDRRRAHRVDGDFGGFAINGAADDELRRHFCVNVLATRHRAVADRFAGRGGVKGAARYAEASWTPLATGALALDDALAAIDCEVEEFVERHSHAIVIGAVRALEVRPGLPLIYGQGQYGSLAPT
jgi:hypothetical protein